MALRNGYEKYFLYKNRFFLLILSGCATLAAYEEHKAQKAFSTIKAESPTMLDGVWELQSNTKYKPVVHIINGVMYYEPGEHPPSIAKPGAMIAKNIYLKHFPFFNVNLGVAKFVSGSWYYGKGEIVVISKDRFRLKYFTNKNSIEQIYTNISLDNPKALAAYFQSNNQDNKLVHSNPPILKTAPPNIIPVSSIGQRFALIIGISNYKDSRIPYLFMIGWFLQKVADIHPLILDC